MINEWFFFLLFEVKWGDLWLLSMSLCVPDWHLSYFFITLYSRREPCCVLLLLQQETLRERYLEKRKRCWGLKHLTSEKGWLLIKLALSLKSKHICLDSGGNDKLWFDIPVLGTVWFLSTAQTFKRWDDAIIEVKTEYWRHQHCSFPFWQFVTP